MCNETTIRTRGVFQGRTLLNQPVCEEHYLLRIALDEFPLTKAGQFVQLQCSPPGELLGAKALEGDGPAKPQLPEWAEDQTLLRRPFSLAARRDNPEGVELDILYRVVGRGTGWMEKISQGQPLSILGPLGGEFPISPTKPKAALIGGGVGIPPMMYLAESLQAAGKSAVAFCGARNKNLLPLSLGPETPCPDATAANCAEEFSARGAKTVITSDDGSIGFHGFVTEALSKWLADSQTSPQELVVYSCGPGPMMKALGELCIARGIECHLSLERSMACGMSTCQSCIVKIKDDTPQGWSFKLCCTHGPVFPAESILWE